MFLQIITQAPIWVWPLFIVLLMLGLRSSKQRTAPTWLVYSLSLLGLISIASLLRTPHVALVFLAYFVGYGLGIALGYRAQQKWIIGKNAGRVEIAGEWMSMTAMMVLYFSNFIGGALQVVAPSMYTSVGFSCLYFGVIALFSGTFTGRALRLWVTPNRDVPPIESSALRT